MLLSLALLAATPAEGVLIAIMALGAMTVTYKLLHPIMLGIGKRLAGQAGTADPRLLEEMEEMRARLHVLEEERHRVLELEDRLDFTERLLLQQREAEPSRLAPGKEG